MIEHLAEVLRDLPAYLGGHMLLSMAAMVVGLAVSLPLGVVAIRRPRLAEMAPRGRRRRPDRAQPGAAGADGPPARGAGSGSSPPSSR